MELFAPVHMQTRSNDINVLAREAVCDGLVIELSNRGNSYFELIVYHDGTYLTGWYDKMQEFEAGRLFQAEVDAYKHILK